MFFSLFKIFLYPNVFFLSTTLYTNRHTHAPQNTTAKMKLALYRTRECDNSGANFVANKVLVGFYNASATVPLITPCMSLKTLKSTI